MRLFRSSESASSGSTGPLVFDASFEVEYVYRLGRDWVRSGTPTPHKRITATVEHPRMMAPVRLARIYSDLR